MTRWIFAFVKQLVLVCLPLFLPGAVLANLCVPDPSEFDQLVATSGARAEIVTPAVGQLLLNGVDTVVKIVPDEDIDSLPYRLFTLAGC